MFQGESNASIYIAVIGSVTTLVGGYLAYLYGRKKTNVEIDGVKKKNDAQELQNQESGNKVLDATQDFIDELGTRVIDLQRSNHQLKLDIELEKMLRAEAEGRAKGAIEDRDKFMSRVRTVESEITELKRSNEEWQQKYSDLEHKFDDLSRKFEAFEK